MNIDQLFDFDFYSPSFLNIRTKLEGLQSLKLRKYQSDFVRFTQDISGPKRIIVLKPRQAGFSTLVSAMFCHKMFTEEFFQGIAMADKHGRTQSIANIYRTFYDELEDALKPNCSILNSEQLFFDVFRSGVNFETANDPNAGRSGTRKFAHLSEAAFYRYAGEIDDGIQNSIPLGEDTYIIKESTANGKAGIGKPFFELWSAAKRNESIYKPFFVSWFEVDDYRIHPPDNFKLDRIEKDLIKQHPEITPANLMWRRLKIKEYQGDEESLLSPDERFKQDFPSNDVEAFLSTGMPVFDPQEMEHAIRKVTTRTSLNLKNTLNIRSSFIEMFKKQLVIYSPPRGGIRYFIGADVAEGLAVGDASSVCILDHEYNQVCSWHGKIDPDLFGHLLIDLAKFYNNAVLCPEVNNMGHTTVTTIRNENYSRIYRETVEDKITKEKTVKLGWRTTAKSKETMLNELGRLFREKAINFRDKNLVVEMSLLTREENGIVKLNGRDRVVALCLACMARKSEVISVKPVTRKLTQDQTIEDLIKRRSDRESFE